MEVKLDKRYPLDVDVQRAWAVLADVRAVAGCMPGASITEEIDPTHFRGTVKLKIGPANAAFGGDIEVQALEPAQRLLKLLAKGADRGGSSASMALTASIEPGEQPGRSVLVGHADVIVNGKFAQFGGRMMVQVSDMILAQFAQNFGGHAAALAPMDETNAAPTLAPTPAPATAAATATATDTASVATAPVTTPSVATASAIATASGHGPDARTATSGAGDAATGRSPGPAPASAAPRSAPAPAPKPAPAPAPPPASELNALAIAWMLIKNWFAGLFGRRT